MHLSTVVRPQMFSMEIMTVSSKCIIFLELDLKNLLYSKTNLYSQCMLRIRKLLLCYPGFPGGSAVKNPLAMKEMWVQSLGWKDPLEEEMATHSSILAWKILWTEEAGRL